MAKQKFKPGDKVKFTREAKDRFDDSQYWCWANYPELDLDRVYTVKGYSNENWPSYCLEEEGTAPHIPDYLLEPVETEQTEKKNMTKKEFILALVQAILPDQDLTYEGCHPYAQVHTGADTIAVKCPRQYGTVQLTLSPTYGQFEETDIELVTKFLKQNCQLTCSEEAIEVTDNGELVMSFANYPWHMVSEIKPSTPEEPVQEEKPNPCDTCEVVRKLQAENQRLKYELDQAKAEIARLKGQANRKADRHGEPWMKAFEFPGGKGIAFGFGF